MWSGQEAGGVVGLSAEDGRQAGDPTDRAAAPGSDHYGLTKADILHGRWADLAVQFSCVASYQLISVWCVTKCEGLVLECICLT